MKATHYLVVAFPKLDNEAQIQRLRDGCATWEYSLRPYIPLVSPVVPATLDELQGFAEHIGRIRRNLHPFALTFYRAVERATSLLFVVERGRDNVLSLHREVYGGEPLVIQGTGEYDPDLRLGRISDPTRRRQALTDLNQLGKTVGIIDALALLRSGPDDALHLALTLPFGVGRVDYHERFPA